MLRQPLSPRHLRSQLAHNHGPCPRTRAYDKRAFDRLPILADALQDAGCDNDDILDHSAIRRPPRPRLLGRGPGAGQGVNRYDIRNLRSECQTGEGEWHSEENTLKSGVQVDPIQERGTLTDPLPGSDLIFRPRLSPPRNHPHLAAPERLGHHAGGMNANGHSS